MDPTIKVTTRPMISKMQFLGAFLLLAGMVVAAVTVGVAALAFGSFWTGKLLMMWLPFSAFEATVVCLLALVISIAVVAKLGSRLFMAGIKHEAALPYCEVCGVHHGDPDDEPDVDGDEYDVDLPNEGLRRALYAAGAIKSNALCPCGSGSRYRKCCGDERLFRAS